MGDVIRDPKTRGIQIRAYTCRTAHVSRVDLLVQQTCVRVFFVRVCTPAYRSLASFLSAMRAQVLYLAHCRPNLFFTSNFQPGISAHREHCTLALPAGASLVLQHRQYSALAFPEVLTYGKQIATEVTAYSLNRGVVSCDLQHNKMKQSTTYGSRGQKHSECSRNLKLKAFFSASRHFQPGVCTLVFVTLDGQLPT